MKRTITFWKNTGHPALRGRTEELFKISWDDKLKDWAKDDDGQYWGMYKLDTKELRRLSRAPETMGDVTSVEEEVDALVAKDVTVTPEGLDLGEEE